MKPKPTQKPIEHPDTTNTTPTYWESVLQSYGLTMWRGQYVRDGDRGKGAKILVIDEVHPRNTLEDEEDDRLEGGQDAVLSALHHGTRLGKYLARTHADERLSALIKKFLSLTVREAAARYNVNAGTLYRLQREFFEERPDRPEVIAARKALGCDDEETRVVELPILQAVVYLALGEAA